MRNQRLECQLLIVQAAEATYNSIKDREGATFTNQTHVSPYVTPFSLGKLVQ